MAVIRDVELAEIVTRAVKEDLIDDADQYKRFLEGLALLVTDHFGGDLSSITSPDGVGGPEDLGWCAHIEPNDSMPEGGGVFAKYDDPEAFVVVPPSHGEHIAEEVLKKITKAMGEFGTHSYYDKGPYEIMDVDEIVRGFRKETPEDLRVALVLLDKNGRAGSFFVETALAEMQMDVVMDFLMEDERLSEMFG